MWDMWGGLNFGPSALDLAANRDNEAAVRTSVETVNAGLSLAENPRSSNCPVLTHVIARCQKIWRLSDLVSSLGIAAPQMDTCMDLDD